MTTLSGSARRTFFVVVFILGCVALLRPNLNAPAQEAPKYTIEEYNAYKAIADESDPAKKMDLIMQFFNTYPKTTLKVNVVADFETMLKKLADTKRWTQVISMGKQFLTVVPDDALTIALLADGYAETKDYRQFVVFGEEMYRTNPSGNLAYAMAKAYKELGNNAKFIEWGEKTVSKLPDNYEILLEIAVIYSDSQRNAEADKYARQCLRALQAAKKPEQTSEKDWTTYTTRAYTACYLIIGSAAYQKQDYVNAIPNLESSLKYNSRNDTAYYWLGQSYWNTQKIDLAMLNFAKASLLGGRTAAAAKQQLENLYKQTHRGSLVGLEKIIDVARAQLIK
jgi:tetratricopeptide (TPR) repeat protein